MIGLEKGWYKIEGHVHIEDDLGQVLLDQRNAVHPENMATLIGRGLSNTADFNIHSLKLGNGGASVGSGGAVTYQPPITTGMAAVLYNQTYFEVVDESDGSAEVGNSVVSSAGSGTQTVVTVNLEIAASQPASQSSTDQAPSTEDDFAFDELGLFSADDLMVTHIIFSPILKSANRTLTITYTLTITVS
jgi:hypothetical protein